LKQPFTRNMIFSLLVCLIAACQTSPPAIHLDEQQQSAMNAILTQAAVEARDQRIKTGKLKKSSVVTILSESDHEVRTLLTESEWLQYDRAGRDYIAGKIHATLSRSRQTAASDVAAESMLGFRSPSAGAHH